MLLTPTSSPYPVQLGALSAAPSAWTRCMGWGHPMARWVCQRAGRTVFLALSVVPKCCFEGWPLGVPAALYNAALSGCTGRVLRAGGTGSTLLPGAKAPSSPAQAPAVPGTVLQQSQPSSPPLGASPADWRAHRDLWGRMGGCWGSPRFQQSKVAARSTTVCSGLWPTLCPQMCYPPPGGHQ